MKNLNTVRNSLYFNLRFDKVWNQQVKLNNYIVPVNDEGYFMSTSKCIEMKEIKLIGRDNYIYAEPNFSLSSNILINQDGIIVGKMESYSEKNIIEELFYVDFTNQMLRVQSVLLKKYFRHVNEYLKGRDVGGASLDNHPVLEQIQAKIIRNLFLVDSLLSFSELENSNDIIIDFLDKASLAMIEIAGGRALLKGNALQIRTQFKLLNKIYFK